MTRCAMVLSLGRRKLKPPAVDEAACEDVGMPELKYGAAWVRWRGERGDEGPAPAVADEEDAGADGGDVRWSGTDVQ